MVKSPNWLDVEHIPIENGSGDEEIPADGRIGRVFGKSQVNGYISIKKENPMRKIVIITFLAILNASFLLAQDNKSGLLPKLGDSVDSQKYSPIKTNGNVITWAPIGTTITFRFGNKWDYYNVITDTDGTVVYMIFKSIVENDKQLLDKITALLFYFNEQGYTKVTNGRLDGNPAMLLQIPAESAFVYIYSVNLTKGIGCTVALSVSELPGFVEK